MKAETLTPTAPLACVIHVLTAYFSPRQAAGKPPMPGFTKGDTVAKDGPHDWTLGPTGARGWIYTANGHSAEARQILVTAVAKGSPAAAVLSVGDVIPGVDGKSFSGDACIQFANAIGVAETEKGGGKLRLLRWRAGKSDEVVVKDPALDRAIAKAAGFVRWSVNKGAVPYGDHQPFPAHEDNGKCASAAVLHDLLGDREAEHGKYTGWDCSGGCLLAYALPLKRLHLTGKSNFSVPAFNAAQVESIIAAGPDYPCKNAENPYDRRATEQLLAGLSSWSSAVRLHSSAALGRRQGNFLPDVLKLLASTNRDARFGACEALGALGPRADAAALTDRDLVELLPAIAQAIERLAPGNEMFGDGIRLAGLDLFSRLHIREGMTLCVSVMEPARGGAGKRVGPRIEYLQRYGSHAKAVLPQLRGIRAQLADAAGKQPKSEVVDPIDKCIAAIESSTARPTVISLAEFKSHPTAK